MLQMRVVIIGAVSMGSDNLHLYPEKQCHFCPDKYMNILT